MTDWRLKRVVGNCRYVTPYWHISPHTLSISTGTEWCIQQRASFHACYIFRPFHPSSFDFAEYKLRSSSLSRIFYRRLQPTSLSALFPHVCSLFPFPHYARPYFTHTRKVKWKSPLSSLCIRTRTCVGHFSAQTKKFVLSLQMSRLDVFRASSASLLWPPSPTYISRG